MEDWTFERYKEEHDAQNERQREDKEKRDKQQEINMAQGMQEKSIAMFGPSPLLKYVAANNRMKLGETRITMDGPVREEFDSALDKVEEPKGVRCIAKHLRKDDKFKCRQKGCDCGDHVKSVSNVDDDGDITAGIYTFHRNDKIILLERDGLPINYSSHGHCERCGESLKELNGIILCRSNTDPEFWMQYCGDPTHELKVDTDTHWLIPPAGLVDAPEPLPDDTPPADDSSFIPHSRIEAGSCYWAMRKGYDCPRLVRVYGSSDHLIVERLGAEETEVLEGYRFIVMVDEPAVPE